MVKGRDEDNATCASGPHGLGGCTDTYNSPGYVDAASNSRVLKAMKAAVHITKTYGFSCISEGAIGAVAGGGAGGFALGCAAGMVNVWLDEHHPVLGAGMTLVMVGHGTNKILVESKFGKGFAKALGQAVCAAYYPACK
jgi:hypothetical protein